MYECAALLPLIPYHEYTIRPGSKNLERCWSPIAPTALVRLTGWPLVTVEEAMNSGTPDGHRSTPPSSGAADADALGYVRNLYVTRIVVHCSRVLYPLASGATPVSR